MIDDKSTCCECGTVEHLKFQSWCLECGIPTTNYCDRCEDPICYGCISEHLEGCKVVDNEEDDEDEEECQPGC